jgi:iron complex transport system ATP-binding protein
MPENDISQDNTILKLNNATVFRGKNKVLENFSVSIQKGEHTAIIGPNGSGKSTFIQLLTSQLYPVESNDGRPAIQILGKSRWNVEELRKQIGIVSADLQYEIKHNLKAGKITGKEVVLSGCFSSMQLFNHQRITDDMKGAADHALKSIEAISLSGQLFCEMSAGEARRVLIARALVTNPEILVLDEPTTALDFTARQKCLELIRNIAQAGRTVIIVTHHLGEIIPEIQQVILLKEGEIVLQGEKEQALTSSNLSDVFDQPLTLHKDHNGYRIEAAGNDAP